MTAPAEVRRIVLQSPAGEIHAWDAPLGQSLLRSAAAAGQPLRSSCRNGTCRTCLCRLLEGQIRYQIEWPGVSAEEKREGWILPCVAEPD